MSSTDGFLAEARQVAKRVHELHLPDGPDCCACVQEWPCAAVTAADLLSEAVHRMEHMEAVTDLPTVRCLTAALDAARRDPDPQWRGAGTVGLVAWLAWRGSSNRIYVHVIDLMAASHVIEAATLPDPAHAKEES